MIQLTEAQRAFLVAEIQRRLQRCVPWTRKLKWAPELNIKADTYPLVQLFPELSPSMAPAGELDPTQYIDSPGGRFRYLVRLHPRGRLMETWWGRETGTVLFDGDILIPTLYERAANGDWSPYPWMSLTPAEFLTLRARGPAWREARS
ncbi:MAG: hypothetical protein HC927_03980 [Deltaproteobacteria bacterium]|nr:hypothetical protein [Deltaproteobacteria bacterium]